MNMTLIRLTPPAATAGSSQNPAPDLPSPEVVADILWAAAIPADALEHVRARSGPGRQIDVAIFHRTGPTVGGRETCLALCRRAIAHSPALAFWAAEPLPQPGKSAPA